ncbi:MAG TPA: glycosyltransferase family 39 protein [Thermoanaerobaculia bacterium]|nr:glycosyltransferase family 39 protein [Thermoanaerobaculia bacterium]
MWVAAAALWLLVLLLWGIDVGGASVPLPLSRVAVLLALAATAVWLTRLLVRRLAGKRGRALAAAAVLPALLILSLTVRCVGLSHEVEGRYYLDEGTYYHHASEINAGRMLRLSFVYPHLMYYLDAVALWMASLFPGAVKAWAGAVGVNDPLGISWLLLRGVVALLSALTVVPVYRIAERLTGVTGGAVAGLLLIASPLFNDGSHLNTCDVPSAVFATLCLLFVARLVDEETTRDYLLAGLFAGLAAGSKYPAGLVVVAIIAVWIRWRWARRDLRFGLLWAGLAAVAAFLAVMPSLLVFPQAAFLGGRGILFGARQYGQGGWLGVVPRSNSLYYARALLASFGWVAALAGLSGLVAIRREERSRWLWLLPFPILYLALITSMSMVVRRNLYPVVPIVAALLGIGIGVWLGRIREARWGARLRPVLVAALLAVCLVQPAWQTGIQAMALARPSTREMAGEWIRAHVPRGASIAKESYTPDFPEGEYRVFHRRFVTRLSLAELQRFDYVLVASAAYGRFHDPAALTRPHQREMAERYTEIFRSWPLVHEWVPSETQDGPVIRLYRRPPPLASSPQSGRGFSPESAQPSVQVLAALQAAETAGPVDPGNRPAASSLGWSLPARWAGWAGPPRHPARRFFHQEKPFLEVTPGEMQRQRGKSPWLWSLWEWGFGSYRLRALCNWRV